MIEPGSRLVNEQRDFGEREVILTSLHGARDRPTDPPATARWYWLHTADVSHRSRHPPATAWSYWPHRLAV